MSLCKGVRFIHRTSPVVFSTPLPPRYKLRWIWYILKGKPYHDTIIIAPERLPEIIQILEELK